MDDLKRQFANEIQTVKFTNAEEKQQKTGTGIPLLSLIKAAELRTEKTLDLFCSSPCTYYMPTFLET